jgi:hypothetical protein
MHRVCHNLHDPGSSGWGADFPRDSTPVRRTKEHTKEHDALTSTGFCIGHGISCAQSPASIWYEPASLDRENGTSGYP